MRLYTKIIKEFGEKFFKEPNQWISVSLVVFLFSLPIISMGIGQSVGIALTKQWTSHYSISLISDIKSHVKKYAVRSLMIFAITLIVIGMMILSLLCAMNANTPTFIRLSLCIGIIINSVFLFALNYAWPVLVYNDYKVIKSVKFGLDIFLLHPFVTIIVWCAWLLVLAVSVFTVIGLVLILPGATMLTQVILYKNIVEYHNRNVKELNENTQHL